LAGTTFAELILSAAILQPQFGIPMDPVPERRLTCWFCREKLGKRFGLVPASISSFWVFRMVE
jgi:hypothetical protein